MTVHHVPPGSPPSPHTSSDDEIRWATGRASRAVLIIDAQGTVHVANPAAHELLGYAEPELIGRSATTLIPGAFRAPSPAGRAILDEVVLPQPRSTSHFHARRADGSRFAVQVARKAIHFGGEVMALTTVNAVADAPRDALVERSVDVTAAARLQQRVLDDLGTALRGSLDTVLRARLERAAASAREVLALLEPPAAAPVAPARTVSAHTGPVTRVVLADDTDEIRDSLRRYLSRRADIEIIGEAVDGAHAVEVATRLQPALVIIDYSMPVLDGLQALPLIRAAVPGVQVIMLSSYGDDVLGAAAMKHGAIAYVQKGSAKSLGRIAALIDEHFPAAADSTADRTAG
ncbi:MAG: response regulator [Jatrophihabitans sp.]|uniref:response regulator n=1 Tax=Jatrophihabitans sp. TaxID=1932789 RepID=UPI003F8067A3